MNFKNHLFAKAGFAFLCSTACCALFNYLSFVFLLPGDEHGEKMKAWLFILYTVQVATAVIAVVYGDILIRRRRFIWKWHGMDELPDVSNGKRKEVVFVTVDGCLFNGFYLPDENKFHGYDGLDFNLDEVLAWSSSQFYIQIKGKYYFPDSSLWKKNDGNC